MKKICLVMLLLVASLSFGQDKYQIKKISYFVDAAQKEFNLDQAKTKELLAARTTYFNDYIKVMNAAKNNEITDDEKKSQSNEVNNKFNKYFGELTGKSWNDLKPFFDRIREELKSQ
jgi:hypothetical protein